MISTRVLDKKVFGTTNTEVILMFYCVMFLNQDFYYLEDEKVLITFQNEAEILHRYDVVCPD